MEGADYASGCHRHSEASSFSHCYCCRCRRQVLGSPTLAGFPGVRPLAGLRHGQGGSSRQQRRSWPSEGPQRTPLVLPQILYVGDEHQGVHGRLPWPPVPRHHCRRPRFQKVLTQSLKKRSPMGSLFYNSILAQHYLNSFETAPYHSLEYFAACSFVIEPDIIFSLKKSSMASVRFG